MNTLHPSPMQATRRGRHAPDGTATVRTRSRCDRWHPNERAPSSARSKSSSCVGQSGSRRARGADHGRARDWTYCFVAHSRGVSAGWGRSGRVRRCAIRSTTPVRHRCRRSSDGACMLDRSCGKAALDTGGTRTRCTPGRWPEQCEPRDRAAHAQENDLKPWRKLMWCIGALTEEPRQRMYALLELYALPMLQAEPVV